ncbi:MAG: hypothetical protein ACRYG8_09995 [Janthinobacterium lividum]
MVTKVGARLTGEVTRVELTGPRVNAVVTVRSGAKVEQYTMDAADLMSAVLLFCRRARIPLSTRSDKRLSLIANCLALTTSINLRRIVSTGSAGAAEHAAAGPDLALMHTV